MGSKYKVILDPVNNLAKERLWLDITDHTTTPVKKAGH